MTFGAAPETEIVLPILTARLNPISGSRYELEEISFRISPFLSHGTSFRI